MSPPIIEQHDCVEAQRQRSGAQPASGAPLACVPCSAMVGSEALTIHLPVADSLTRVAAGSVDVHEAASGTWALVFPANARLFPATSLHGRVIPPTIDPLVPVLINMQAIAT